MSRSTIVALGSIVVITTASLFFLLFDATGSPGESRVSPPTHGAATAAVTRTALPAAPLADPPE